MSSASIRCKGIKEGLNPPLFFYFVYYLYIFIPTISILFGF
nr:MAG TPA: hypothetical protein [Caudoviricetes sp.]